MVVLELACLAVWALAMRPEGEIVMTVTGHRWNPAETEHLLGQFDAINTRLGANGESEKSERRLWGIRPLHFPILSSILSVARRSIIDVRINRPVRDRDRWRRFGGAGGAGVGSTWRIQAGMAAQSPGRGMLAWSDISRWQGFLPARTRIFCARTPFARKSRPVGSDRERRIIRLYLKELAADFHRLHAKARVLVAESPEQYAGSGALLVQATVRVLADPGYD